jgi:hypothetical protein
MIEANRAVKAQLGGRPENRAMATQLPKTSCTQRSEAGSGVMRSRASISFWS